jgi:hypothetical protein
MTRKIALAQYLLAGGKLSIMNAYRHFGISNVSREAIRLIEKPFNVVLTRTKMEGKTKYGSHCEWFEYRLVSNRINAKGIKAMKEAFAELQSVTKCNQLKKKVVKMKAKS